MTRPKGALLHSTVRHGVNLIEELDNVLVILMAKEPNNEELPGLAHQVSLADFLRNTIPTI